MSSPSEGVCDFEKKEEENKKLTQEVLQLAYPMYWSALGTLKDAIKLLIEECRVADDKHTTALLLLTNRAIQHIESMRVLTECGLYGDAFALLRSLTSDLAMMQYLNLKPELVADFLNEKQEDYQDKKTGFSAKFNERVIHDTLVAAGVKPFGSTFQVLSKASHASAFGAQLYGSRGQKSGDYHFKYGPGFESEKALGLMTIIVTGFFDILENLLIYRSGKEPQSAPPPAWSKIEDEMMELETSIDVFNEAAKETLKKFWPPEENK